MRLRLPLEPEDVMKLFDKAIEFSAPVKALADSLKACAEGLEKVAMTLAVVAHNQAAHHQMIAQMWSTHQAIVKKMNENAMDASMPELGDKEKAKPN